MFMGIFHCKPSIFSDFPHGKPVDLGLVVQVLHLVASTRSREWIWGGFYGGDHQVKNPAKLG